MTELLALAYGLASLTLKDESDQTWLVRRFSQMYDMLHETRAYQELIRERVEKGLEKGLQRGLEQGLEQGRLERVRETRETLDEVILERFPNIVRTVKGPLSSITDVKTLRHLIVKMSIVQNAEEALRYIRALTEQSE